MFFEEVAKGGLLHLQQATGGVSWCSDWDLVWNVRQEMFLEG